ncbi:hypothetical protein Acr_00g0041650 [Actinidia rufa]|uniref:Uncharacterized protein n=1 Tax=Actinidia rufa TaxID=165716 RepID=A0A7J0DJW1_9ERIC|nr:hypothetical protein Acr_00g0041650 [Actinidia rufa]
MEVGGFSSDVVAMEKLMVCSVVEAVAVETLLAAHRSLACLLMVGSTLKNWVLGFFCSVLASRATLNNWVCIEKPHSVK